MPNPRGPVPKRSDQRRRRNKDVPMTTGRAAEDVVQPDADPDWHPIAREWYDSLAESGQSFWFEPSDWATAKYVAEAMSRNLLSGRFSGQLFAAVLAGTTSLLSTEGDRRRLRIELERGTQDTTAEDAKVAVMDRYRKARA